MELENDKIFNDCYQKAINLLNYAPQTEKKLFLKLFKKGYSKNMITAVINKLKEYNLINDLENARIYAETLAKIKFAGINKIIIKLREKGISKENAANLANEVINENGGEELILKNYIKKNSNLILRLINSNEIDKIKYKIYHNGFSELIISKFFQNLVDNVKKLL